MRPARVAQVSRRILGGVSKVFCKRHEGHSKAFRKCLAGVSQAFHRVLASFPRTLGKCFVGVSQVSRRGRVKGLTKRPATLFEIFQKRLANVSFPKLFAWFRNGLASVSQAFRKDQAKRFAKRLARTFARGFARRLSSVSKMLRKRFAVFSQHVS